MARNSSKSKRRYDVTGFTLVELVITIAVLAILSGIGALGYSGYITKANEAHDLALLGAVNTAFQSAYTEKELATYPKTAVATLDGSEGELALIDLSATNESGEPISGFFDVFKKYFEGNDDAIFKVYTGLKYGIEPGVFNGILPKGELALTNGMKMKAVDDGTTTKYTVTDGSGKKYEYEVQNNDLETFNGSTFGQNMEMSSLMGEVDNVVQALKGVLMTGGTPEQLEGLLGADYLQSLGLKKEDFAGDNDAYLRALTNAVVMNVADASAGLTADDVINQTDKFKQLQSDNLLAMMAATYGAATGYANSEIGMNSHIKGSSMTVKEYYDQQSKALRELTNPTDAIGIIFGMLTDIEGSDGFEEYQTSGAYADDLNGYFSALNTLHENRDTLVEQGVLDSGFADENLGAILDAMFG